MLFSLALIFILGFFLSFIFNKIKIPSLVGMILTGILLGPSILNCISPEILNISSELRKIALIVILLRAGLSLNIKDLKKVGRPALLMCFIPAILEIFAVTLFAPFILKISYLEAIILGCVLAAVSPAIIVPRMINLMEKDFDKQKNIPQLIMASASMDDIIVIVLFTSFLNMYKMGTFNINNLLSIPTSIFLGLLLGIIFGIILIFIFNKTHIRDTTKVLIILSICFLLVTLEDYLKSYVAISALISIMIIGIIISKYKNNLSKRLLLKFSKVWVGAEILLFVLVGATVNITYLGQDFLRGLLLIILALMFRSLGVLICFIKTNLNFKQVLFCVISYIPKATVQAAIGTITLTSGISAGNVILSIAILSIIITAPLGSFLIDKFSVKLLN